ncbi:hypothetical protein VR46_45570, partial [Streptomyces sp. NRRL S-444]
QPGTHADLDKGGIASLLSALKEVGEEEAKQQLSKRAATHANLANALGISFLLSALKKVGEEEALQQLLA